MIPAALRRPLAAAALALHALAVLVLLPAHLLEGVAAPSGPRGPVVGAACPDRDCHDPSHGHRDGHAHDPATCVSCAQARASAAPAPAGPVLAEVGEARRAAPAPASSAARSLPRGLPAVRGPPTLSA